MKKAPPRRRRGERGKSGKWETTNDTNHANYSCIHSCHSWFFLSLPPAYCRLSPSSRSIRNRSIRRLVASTTVNRALW